jgi:hypothetical protein
MRMSIVIVTVIRPVAARGRDDNSHPEGQKPSSSTADPAIAITPPTFASSRFEQMLPRSLPITRVTVGCVYRQVEGVKGLDDLSFTSKVLGRFRAVESLPLQRAVAMV